MAWQTPTHCCGHTGERYQAYGKHTERAKKLAWFESRPCPSCLAAEAKAHADSLGLPVLTGSDKQITWGSEIRAKAIKQMTPDEVAASNAHTSASWWITNRYLWG